MVSRYLNHRQLQQLVQRHLHDELEVFELKNGNEICLLRVKKGTVYRLRTRSPKLRRLVLAGCSLQFISSEDLPPTVRYLSVRGSELNVYCFFGSQLHLHVPYLTCLDVGGVSNFFSSEDLYTFSNLQNLRCLYMEGCFRINSGGIESIVDIMPRLRVLDVEGTDVSNEGVIVILTHCVDVRELYLGHLDVDDEALSRSPPNRLQKLCVKQTRITQQGIEQFVGGCPKKVNLLPFENWNREPHVNPSIHLDFCKHYLSHSCAS